MSPVTPTPAKRPGRKRGLNVNAPAVEDLLRIRVLSKRELSRAVGITPGHLSDMLHSDKGASEETVRRLAATLDCDPRTICPTLSPRFLYRRAGDDEAAA